jgi:hypothetical protein
MQSWYERLAEFWSAHGWSIAVLDVLLVFIAAGIVLKAFSPSKRRSDLRHLDHLSELSDSWKHEMKMKRGE